MFLDPFEGPFLKLERAGYHFIELTETISDYQSRAIPQFVKTDRHVDPWELQLSEPVPPIVSLQVGDIAHSLRSALDVMMCDIALVRGIGISDMKFPFAMDEPSFQAMLDGPKGNQPFKKLGADVVAMIRNAQPYKGGNILLRGLHDLNNSDKHRMVVPVVTFASTVANMAPMMKKKYNIDILSMGTMLVALGLGVPISDDDFFEHPSEHYTINPKTMRVCFPEDYSISGEITKTMGDLIDVVFNLVQTFKATVIPE